MLPASIEGEVLPHKQTNKQHKTQENCSEKFKIESIWILKAKEEDIKKQEKNNDGASVQESIEKIAKVSKSFWSQSWKTLTLVYHIKTGNKDEIEIICLRL